MAFARVRGGGTTGEPGPVARAGQPAAKRQPQTLGWIALTTVCVALLIVAVPVTRSWYGTDVTVAFLLSSVLCGSVLVAPRAPVVASLVHLAALTVTAVVTAPAGGTPWPLPVTGLVAFMTLLTVLALQTRTVLAVVVWWGGILLLLATVAVERRAGRPVGQWGASLVAESAISALVLAVAMAVGQRGRIRRQLEDARRDVALEQAARRHAEERSALARELHDVVAHSMSTVQIQAASAPYRLAQLDPAAREEFSNIAQTAKVALDEMRQLLGALRPERGGPLVAPQPQVSELGRLAAMTTGAGCTVDLVVDPAAADLGAVTQVTIYRIVQEGLGNVVRHAPHAATQVAVRVGRQHVLVEVVNLPTPPDRLASAVLPPPDRSGRGLLGMRERVALLGGELETGATSTGGFRVSARLPKDDHHEQLEVLR